jgi:hypothetical protein
MYKLAELPHMGETGATEALTFLALNEIRDTPANEERGNNDPCSSYIRVQ